MKSLFLTIISAITLTSSFTQNEFTFDLYKTMNKNQEGNILFSPTSIMTAFAMVYEGADTETKAEFETVFKFKPDNQAFISQINELKKVANISNSVWVHTAYQILPEYINKLETLFKASPYSCDFQGDPQGSASKINEWISKNTNGLINKMVDAETVQGFKMALVNAVYFKQDWKKVFNKDLNEEAPFFNLDGSETQIELMCSVERYYAAETPKEKIISIPYNDDKTSMVIIMPNNMNNYKIDHESYHKLVDNLYNQKVNLRLPKFTF